MVDKPPTRVDEALRRIQNNRIVAVVIVLGIAIIALGSLSDALLKIGTFFTKPNSAQATAINAGTPESPAPTTHVSAVNLRDFPIRIVNVTGAEQLSGTLRRLGYRVVTLADQGDPEQEYNAISIGKDVPAEIVRQVIRVARNDLPQLKYAFIQYELPKFDGSILVNAHQDWATHIGLRELSESDFAKLTREGLTKEEIHSIIEGFER